MWISGITNHEIRELDELYWYVEKRPRKETRENIYVTTMVSREPRQIVGFSAGFDKSPKTIQSIVDSAPNADKYCTDGYLGYTDVIYPGRHVRNIANKNDTFTVEGVNADLRHYIAALARRSRCFFRKTETLEAVLAVFVDAYNKFGEAKQKYRVPVKHKKDTPSKRLHKYRDAPFSIIDFL